MCTFALRLLADAKLGMKQLWLLSWVLLVSLTIEAAPISESQALAKARSFVANKRYLSIQEITLNSITPSTHRKVVAEALPYYIFNIGENQGFVLISGDDRLTPILGYSEAGTFNEQQLPDNLQNLLDDYTVEYQSLPANSNSSVRQPKSTKSAISPMLTTQWGQGAPYNLYCPRFVTGEQHCAVGCVGTAMAQVAYHVAHTRTDRTALLHGIRSYTCSTVYELDGVKGNVSVPAIPEGTEINWSSMRDEYSATDSDEGAMAVARLLAVCAASVRTQFTIPAYGSSTSNTLYVTSALVDQFGFDSTISYRQRVNYTLQQWTDLIYDELSAGRPVIYRGSSSGGGHAFVIDGYEDGLFHVNWGWGGKANGFFSLSVMNPLDNSGIGASTTHDGYTNAQGAVIGIQMGSGQTADSRKMLTSMRLSVNNQTITYTPYNLTGDTHKFEFGIGFIDDRGRLEAIKSSSTGFLSNFYSYSSTNFTMSGHERSAGTYKIVPISRIAGETEWNTDWNASYQYVEAVYDRYGLLSLTLHPSARVTATDMHVSGPHYAGAEHQVTVTFKSQGEEVYQTYYLFASTTSFMGDAVSMTGVTIPADGTQTASFLFTPTYQGTYNLWIATDSEGHNVIGQTSVSIMGNTDDHGTTGIKSQPTNHHRPADVWYDLHGQRVNRPLKGIYLRNGKKYSVRFNE